MEHGLSMRLRAFTCLILFIFGCIQTALGAPPPPQALQAPTALADKYLVLVVNEKSPIKTLTAAQARKLFLGEPLRIDGKTIIPLRNSSDPLLQEIFMQRVMYMATETYERQILNRVFRAGGQRPPIYSDFSELLQALQNDPLTVSYMWSRSALPSPGIRVIGR